MPDKQELGIIEMNESELGTFLKALAKTRAVLKAEETSEGLILLLSLEEADEDELVCTMGFIENYIGDLVGFRVKNGRAWFIYEVKDDLAEWD